PGATTTRCRCSTSRANVSSNSERGAGSTPSTRHPREGPWDTDRRVDFQEEEAQVEAAERPAGVFAGREGKDFRVLAAGTAQNIVGLGLFVGGSVAENVLIARSFGGGATGAIALGIVTVGTQFAFSLAAGSRFGMDMAAVRYVAIDIGAGHPGRIRPLVATAIEIAAAISIAVGAVVFVVAGPVGRALGAQ